MSAVTRTIIVDDHDVVRAGLASTLETFEGFKVVGMAANEKDATKIFEEIDEFDLLIMDIALEDSNSFNIVRNIKKKHKNIKVIFISGFTEEEYHMRMHEAGGDGFWCKLDSLKSFGTFVKKSQRVSQKLLITVLTLRMAVVKSHF